MAPDSLIARCLLFARELYKPDVILNALRLSGFDHTEESLRALGESIHTTKFRFKLREGFSFETRKSLAGSMKQKVLWD